jgi:hypothetical protein
MVRAACEFMLPSNFLLLGNDLVGRQYLLIRLLDCGLYRLFDRHEGAIMGWDWMSNERRSSSLMW